MKNIFCEIMQDALKGGYAIGAFNFVNMESLYAIAEEAEELKSPVIVAVSEGALKYMGENMFKAYKCAVQSQFSVPICFHLDHGKSVESVKRAIDIGFDSVMIDLSGLSFEENIKGTKEIVEYAHARNVGVEAELGTLAGVEDEVSCDEGRYTDPKQVKLFVDSTGVDALAIAIGTSHGAFKFSGEPKLRFDILEEIEALVPDLPLVLHGASSISQDTVNTINSYGGNIKGAKGIPDEFLSKASKMHICKVNTDSDLRLAYVGATRKILTEKLDLTDPRDIFKAGKKAQKEIIRGKIVNVFGSSNRV